MTTEQQQIMDTQQKQIELIKEVFAGWCLDFISTREFIDDLEQILDGTHDLLKGNK